MQIANQRRFSALASPSPITRFGAHLYLLVLEEKETSPTNIVINADDLPYRTNPASHPSFSLAVRLHFRDSSGDPRNPRPIVRSPSRVFSRILSVFARRDVLKRCGAFFTSKRVFRTHVTGSAKTGWEYAGGRGAAFPKYCRCGPRQRLKLQFKPGSGTQRRSPRPLGDNSSLGQRHFHSRGRTAESGSDSREELSRYGNNVRV